MTIDDTGKRPEDTPIDEREADTGVVTDDGWSKVDLHDRKPTPEADTPSDLEPPPR